MSDEGTPNVEQEAERYGWVPKERYRGPEDEWVTAEEFVERGKKINPILRSNNERLKRELAEKDRKHEAELQELRQSTEEVKRFIKEAAEKKVGDLEAQLRQLRTERSQATVQEDHERVAEIEEQIDEVKAAKEALKNPPKKETKEELPPAPQIDPLLQAWLDKNQWYGDADNYLEESEIATAIAKSLRIKSPHLKGDAFFEALDEKIDAQLNVRKKKNTGPSVEGGSSSKRVNVKGSKHSYENLPADAKAACDKFVKQKLMTAEQYVEAYDWSE